jgi:hypothetical protein
MEWESFLPPFFGVLAAFALQWLAKRYDKRKDRQKFLGEVKKELEDCSRLLTGEGNLMPIDMWEAGKASGFLSLVKRETKFTLAPIYFRIQCHNYESEKVRDVGILAETTKAEKPKAEFTIDKPDKEIVVHLPCTYPELLWQSLSVRLKKDEEKLRKDIEDLLKQNVWN